MVTAETEMSGNPPEPRNFRTTHWSVVLLAGRAGSTGSAEALEKLCRSYWYPLYIFVRRRGYDAEEAKDLTQSFFSAFLERNYLENVHGSKGRFRTFLLASLNHFLANEWDRSQRKKRGGHYTIISLDEHLAEDRYDREPATAITPENIFDRRWALTVMEIVLARLREEFSGKGEQFDVLKIFLVDDRPEISYGEIATRLGLSESAVKSAIYRLRQRYAQLFRAEIANTVGSPEEIEEEIRYLCSALTLGTY